MVKNKTKTFAKQILVDKPCLLEGVYRASP